MIKSAKFIKSIADIRSYCEFSLAGSAPEICVVGRSNVGKSSFINFLTRRKKLAKTSSTPGRTRLINLFDIDEGRFVLVDLPGYGYAKTAQTNRKQWAKFIEEYFLNSEHLQFVCQLIDIRHAPMKSDIEMFNWLVKNNVPVLIIATKADKISRGAVAKQVAQIKKMLGVKEIDILPYSSVKNAGRSELLEVIYQMLTD